ncbi:acetyl-CoA carboxylase, biotin carboxylase subunit [Alteribacillus persepolensis]|uniref:biotin carboxylase n=1 Tax=Alteribacillus persepolensis TaxID=568899 RepID=A0A1G8DCL0_9BACI|nr:acetyl-CoA carboxylase biotin carboxylase subunit [Alteribacillus persepolensis]SDH55139.1 acetyl-CoA carboxylase, biotin carboxylase subunit [Alteribacillus persepolensis]
MFGKILIANRGEVACRIVRACEELGIMSAAVYSKADADAEHVRRADEAYPIGPSPVKDSYLNMESILQAAKDAGCDAIHPGYGFLSENADFARRCEVEGITFIGPSAEVIRLMGDKIRAKNTMKQAGVPIIPGTTAAVADVASAKHFAKNYGYPLMVKASAGGGGIGMEQVNNERELEKAMEGNKSRAKAYFGDDTLYIEKKIERAKHIEVQVVSDARGKIIHLGERECSIQRRHQKVIEESPSSFLDEKTRQKMGETAVRAAAYIGYENAGTLEFLVDEHQNFYFLEMNTRLQVEHPVTEEAVGVDIVQWQIRIAAGEALSISQSDVAPRSHAIEARIYAEDPVRFFPSPGTITHLSLPKAAHIRHECGVREGSVVTPFYDPLLAKIIAVGKNRKECISRLIQALRHYKIEGIKTNIPMIMQVLSHDVFISGQADITFVNNMLAECDNEKGRK